MPQFEILQDFPGSPDGGRVIQFVKGQIVDSGPDFPQSLSDVAVAEHWAEEVKPKKDEAKPKKKAAKRK